MKNIIIASQPDPDGNDRGRRLPKRVAVFPDIELKWEDCKAWTRKWFSYRMPPGLDWEDLLQATLLEILEDEQARCELDQIAKTPATILALRAIHRSGELADALVLILKVPDATQALIGWLEQSDSQPKLRRFLQETCAESDAQALGFMTRDLQEILVKDKNRHALLIILQCGEAQAAVLAMLRQFPLVPILRRILRWWPAFELSTPYSPSPLIPFEAAFKQTCYGRWADAWRLRGRTPRLGEILEETTSHDGPVAVDENIDCHELKRQRDEALRALTPRERLVVCLSYMCDVFPAAELGQILGLAKLRIQAQVSGDAFILTSKRGALGGNLRLSFFSVEMGSSELKRILGLVEICIPVGFLRADLSEGEIEQLLAGQIQLSFFRDDLTSEELGEMLGLPGLRVVRMRALEKMRKFIAGLR